jgi:predicted ATPase
LEGYAASRPEAERNEMANRYPALARFVPSLGTKSQLAPPAADPFDLIPAIVRLLTELGSKQPVLIVLGDLHEADVISLNLVRYLAQLAVQRSWLMVGTIREEEVEPGTELQRMLDAAVRERLCSKVDVQCLSREDCDEFVRPALPSGGARDELLRQIYIRSRGNPLFAQELARDMHDSQELVRTNGDRQQASWLPPRVPTRVRALAKMRLAGTDETVRRVLTLTELRDGAAALEPPISGAALFGALDRALNAGFLEERTDGYAFRHPLLRSTLFQALPRHRRDEVQKALGRSQLESPHQLTMKLVGNARTTPA